MITKPFQVLSILAGLILASAEAPAQIQCLQDDGFAVPGACCVGVTPTLPLFPAIGIPSEGCVFRDCIPQATFAQNIFITAPSQLFCDVYIAQVQITGLVNPAPAILVAKYTRTWVEIGPTGTPARQVWRFLVNTDLVYPVGGPPAPIPTPTIALAGQAAHFIGSLDYARDCATGQWRAAINLTYLCEDFMHGSFSVNPAPPGTNPNHVYSFMGPGPIAWGAGAPPAGATVADAVRTTSYNLTTSPLLWKCLSKLPTFGGVLSTVAQYCACAIPGVIALPGWSQQNLQFNYGCNAAVANAFGLVPFGPLLPTGLSALTLGAYTGAPGTFPGNRSMSLYIGVATAADPCAGGLPIHLVTGVGTTGGPAALISSPGSPVPVSSSRFLDLENMMVLIGSPPFIGIGVGGLFLSTQIFTLNF